MEQVVDGLIVKALKTWDMIKPGERILLGASGGKDSAILARDLALKKRHGRLDAELVGLHLRNDFTPDTLTERLAEEYAGWGVPLVVKDVAVEGRLKPGRKMNCYWCSTQRRTELIRYAISEGFSSVALGHHLDDVLETLFMNMMQKGELPGGRTADNRTGNQSWNHYGNVYVRLQRPLGTEAHARAYRGADRWQPGR